MKTVALLLSGVVIACAALSPVRAAEEAAKGKPDLTKGAAVAQACASCHTSDGSRGVATYPILQGQHADYLAKQLHDFKAGRRKNAVMSGMAAPLSDEDIVNVAAFYASKSSKPGFGKNKSLVGLGEKIYRGGIADRSIPACAGCHLANGIGMPSQYPRIGSQHGDYIVAQMNAFRSGERSNSPQMAGVAAKMSDMEIKAVSDYIAGLR